jgi:hypothetical protein
MSQTENFWTEVLQTQGLLLMSGVGRRSQNPMQHIT